MMSSLFSISPAPVNHVLAQEPWACRKLAAHAGKVARLDLEWATVTWQVTRDGLLRQAAAEAIPDVVIRMKLADLPLLLQNRERAVSYVRIEGDADFANTLSQLSQSVKWEAEEDLSRWVGDVAAHRIVTTARSAAVAVRSTQQALIENVAEYFLEENPLLVRAQPISEFAREINKLRDDVERLEKRIRKLDKH